VIDRRRFLAGLGAAALGALAPACRRPDEPAIDFYRVFGGCNDTYGGVVDLSLAHGECGVIQVLTNRFAAEHRDVRVRAVPVVSGSYYDRLGAAFAAGAPPDVALMHASILPDFVERDLVFPIDVDLSDVVAPAREAVTFGGRAFAMPFDAHALLFHVNVDLLDAAGLVDEGRPLLPDSPDAIFEHAERVRKATGRAYMVIPSLGDPMPGWLWSSWVWQQGENLLRPDGTVTLDTPEAVAALALLKSVFDRGASIRAIDYASSEQAFLADEVAITVNGTWLVDVHDAETRDPASHLRRYRALTAPRIFEKEAAWADHHTWVLPRSRQRPAPHPAARALLGYLYANDGAWASTGHLPVRKSVLGSAAFRALPQRAGYASTTEVAGAMPRVSRQRTIGSIVGDELTAVWLMGRDPAVALKNAQRRVERALERLTARGSRAPVPRQ
jgi:multiple sugar transport system substrate-binding protein